MPRLIPVLVLIAFSLSLNAQVRKDFKHLESLFLEGNLSEARQSITKLKPNKDDEHALVKYYEAILNKNNADALSLLTSCAEKYSKTHYGQLAMLEAAKIHILERDMNKAKTLLRRITSPDIVERFYWTAVVFYWLDDFSTAIANAENYIRLDASGIELEAAQHLISDSYIKQKKYQSAISSLNKIGQLKNYDKQYHLYKLGLAYELSGNFKNAQNSYREGYELNKYSQVAFNIEERLFALRSKAPAIDLSFLYPYTPLDIQSECEQDSSLVVESFVAKTGTDISEIKLPEIDSSQPIKLIAKPINGNFLQAGRFSIETNAERLCKTIRAMKIPSSYYEDNTSEQITWVVLAGPFTSREYTDHARVLLNNVDINSFVVQY
ncbi:MAG: SPOR domain-containing protein [Candidatus Cloacimonetes bacterium]|nr:SPOR domain-containing protein [Candidatus Cloacimonadota bacterium]